MSNKRAKRGSYLSKSEAEMLISLIIKYGNELQDERIDAVSLRKKDEIWKRITDEFNANSSQFRSVSQVKGKYKNIKRTLRKNGDLRSRKKRDTFDNDNDNPYDDRQDDEDDDDEFDYKPDISKSFGWNNYDSPRISASRSLADNTMDDENTTNPSEFLDHSALNPLLDGHPKSRGSRSRRKIPNNEDVLKREEDLDRDEDIDREEDLDREENLDREEDMQREEESSGRAELLILEKRILEKKLENLEIEREQSATEHLLRVQLLKIQIKSFKEKTFPSETD